MSHLSCCHLRQSSDTPGNHATRKVSFRDPHHLFVPQAAFLQNCLATGKQRLLVSDPHHPCRACALHGHQCLRQSARKSASWFPDGKLEDSPTRQAPTLCVTSSEHL